MKRILILSLLSVFTLHFSFGMSIVSELGKDYKIIEVNRNVGDFKLDSINLSSPLNYYLSRAWIRANGKNSMWADISSIKFEFNRDEPDETPDTAMQQTVMNESIVGIVTYKDSVGAIITREAPDYFLINTCWIENGLWVNGGQQIADNETELIDLIKHKMPEYHSNLSRIEMIRSIPDSPDKFTEFLKSTNDTPEQFLLSKLKKYKLVINGEQHRRKVSWDMLKRLIASDDFHKTVGTIFMELPSWHQPTMDKFMASDTLNPNYILDIFRDEQPNGWWDRGEFEFICQIWNLNKSLDRDEKIRVILADYQIPYSLISDNASINQEDRNTHMADIIENYISVTTDSRNHLFLVGCAHASKSDIPGKYSTPSGQHPAKEAGAQLSERLGKDNVYSVLQHNYSKDNSGGHKRLIRGGIFDMAFLQNGNKPIGFDLKGSPFGSEPFDALYETKYDIRSGCYSDCFDGYLFLHALDTEPTAEPLHEIFSDEFIAEMKRRSCILGLDNATWLWFGVKAQSLTKDIITKALSSE